MRKIILVLTVVFLSSCSNFLEENVRGVIAPNNFYNSDEEAIQAANGIYLGMRTDNLYKGWQGISTFTFFGSDEAMPSRIFGGLGAIMDYNLTETNYSNAYNIWRDLYAVIGDANSVLVNVEGNNNISVQTQDVVIGEALFLRALAYYHLTALWGDVPFFTEDLPLDEVAVLGRTNLTEIRAAMIEDLMRSEALLPSTNDGADIGRATKWAAKYLRTRFHLWEKDWASALAASKDIIDNSPHALMPTYGEVFDPNNLFNQEAIFGFDFTKDVPNNAQSITDSFNPRLRDEPRDASLRNEFAGKLSDIGEEFNGYGLAVPLTDLVETYPMDDPRRPYNLMNEYLGYDLTFTYFKKRTNFDFVNSPRYNHGEWWITMRLASVYLMAAEAANELGNTGEALTYVNEIRRRAYGEESPVAATAQSGIRKAIQDELKWELAGETERRYDLIRWGILVETVRNASYGMFEGPQNIQDHMVKLPIPQEEIDLNPNLLDSDASNNGYR